MCVVVENHLKLATRLEATKNGVICSMFALHHPFPCPDSTILFANAWKPEKTMRRLVLVMILVSWSVDSALGAKVWFHEEYQSFLLISGEITHGDYRKVVNKILEHGAIPPRLNIKSPGGDVMEAIKIGRLARSGLIEVEGNLPCNSACTPVYFAGVPSGRFAPLNIPLGIHRPYFEKRYFAGLSIEEARKEYKRLEQEVISYLYEMNVPTVVIEKMMTVPSDDVFWLSQKGYRKLAGAMAPAFEEWIKAKDCNSLSRKEWEDQSFIPVLLDVYDYLLKAGRTEAAKNMEAEVQAARRSIPEEYPEEYIEYLRNKRKEWRECWHKAVGPARVRYFDKLKREHGAQ